MKAFPQKYPIDASEPHHWVNNPLDRGMDLRDYFAAQVLSKVMEQWPSTDFIGASEIAYDYADAMMKARSE